VKRLAVVGAVVIVLFGSGIAVLLATREDRTDGNPTLEVLDAEDSEGTEVDYDYVIPAGTQDRKLRGELVEIMPPSLDVEVGESIRIRNDDEAGAMVGIFYVGAGEVVSMRFTTPGTLTGACDVSPGGEFTINVADQSA
jgi:hypothetical protein